MLADPSAAAHHQYGQCQYTTPPPSSHSHPSHPQHVSDPNANPFVLYSRSLHDYTLRLWTESRRIAEEKAAMKAAMRRAEDDNRQYNRAVAQAQAHAQAQMQIQMQMQPPSQRHSSS